MGYRPAMNLLPFGELPICAPRRFVRKEINLADWSQIEPLFDQLETRASLCLQPAQLEDWILACGELKAALEEEGSKRYIAMTCHTDNADAEKAYLHFVEQIEPQIKPRQFNLDEIFLAHPHRKNLPRERYGVFDRSTCVHVELFRPENVPLETEESKLSQQYQKLAGAMTVNFRGEEKTLVQMGRYLEEQDRALRQESWELVVNRRLQEAEKFEDIFDQLLKLREKIAINAGFPNYLEYAFRDLERFDYTPEDCANFHQTIESEFMPMVRELQAERRDHLKIPELRPWDLAVDSFNRPPLRPFEQVDKLQTGVQKIFDRLDAELSGGFLTMQKFRLLDLANRKGKAPGGYQSTLAESRLPFIFMNAVGQQRDVETMLHEAGHAFHALATRSEDLFDYRSAPIEFCEVASMSMELLGNEHLDAFYTAPEIIRARRTHLEGIVGLFPWIATVDAFQHWIYSHPNHTRSQRSKAWLELMNRFGGDVNWSGYEKARENLWHRQLHIFIHPLYYIEYGIAQLGALQVWSNSKKDKAQVLHQYQAALKLGGSRPLPELFASAGCRFDFNPKTVKPLVTLIRNELQALH